MSRSTVPPSRDRFAETTKKRLTALERRVDDFRQSDYRPEVTFSSWGLVIAGESPVYVPREVVLVTDVVGLLTTASSSGGVSFEVKRSGITLTTITIPEGSLAVGPERLEEAFSPDTDRLSIEVTSPGSLAEGLTVICRLR